jgi:putative oxidoreductase
MKAVFLIGRIVFGGFFLYHGIEHFRQRRLHTEYARLKKVPSADAGVILTGLMLLAGGASIILGLKPKLGALAIAAFLGGTSPLMHDFWRQQDPNQRMSEMYQFEKNLALLGATLALMGMKEPWPVSATSVQHPRGTQRVLEFARKLAA